MTGSELTFEDEDRWCCCFTGCMMTLGIGVSTIDSNRSIKAKVIVKDTTPMTLGNFKEGDTSNITSF